MARPITLFTGQWADLPFEEVARLASSWGYDGLEIACSGEHLDVTRRTARGAAGKGDGSESLITDVEERTAVRRVGLFGASGDGG